MTGNAAMFDKKGFTMMEMLVSVVVMGVVMLGLAYGYMLVQQRNLSLLLRQKAEEAIQAHMEDLRSRDLGEVTDQPDSLGAMTLSGTQNLNAYCNPADETAPDDPLSTGSFVFRRASGAEGPRVNYETVYKVFDTVSDTGVILEGTQTIVATICWSYRGKLYYITRKTILQTGGL